MTDPTPTNGLLANANARLTALESRGAERERENGALRDELRRLEAELREATSELESARAALLAEGQLGREAREQLARAEQSAADRLTRWQETTDERNEASEQLAAAQAELEMSATLRKAQGMTLRELNDELAAAQAERQHWKDAAERNRQEANGLLGEIEGIQDALRAAGVSPDADGVRELSELAHMRCNFCVAKDARIAELEAARQPAPLPEGVTKAIEDMRASIAYCREKGGGVFVGKIEDWVALLSLPAPSAPATPDEVRRDLGIRLGMGGGHDGPEWYSEDNVWRFVETQLEHARAQGRNSAAPNRTEGPNVARALELLRGLRSLYSMSVAKRSLVLLRLNEAIREVEDMLPGLPKTTSLCGTCGKVIPIRVRTCPECDHNFYPFGGWEEELSRWAKEDADGRKRLAALQAPVAQAAPACGEEDGQRECTQPQGHHGECYAGPKPEHWTCRHCGRTDLRRDWTHVCAAPREPTQQAAPREEPPAEPDVDADGDCTVCEAERSHCWCLRCEFCSTVANEENWRVCGDCMATFQRYWDAEHRRPAPAPSLARLTALADRWCAHAEQLDVQGANGRAGAGSTRRCARELREALAAGAELPGLPSLPDGWYVERVDDVRHPCAHYCNDVHSIECYDDGDVLFYGDEAPYIKAAELHAVLAHHLAHASKGGA